MLNFFEGDGWYYIHEEVVPGFDMHLLYYVVSGKPQLSQFESEDLPAMLCNILPPVENIRYVEYLGNPLVTDRAPFQFDLDDAGQSSRATGGNFQVSAEELLAPPPFKFVVYKDGTGYIIRRNDSNEGPKKCSCELSLLLQAGCKCGGV